ncbi:ATP-binding protein [Nitratidesulfovibrio termitidis]|uniref:ATP-binding protein n=1 Tax=Nitratidesulfovibrio termitidis TaxID=42252 RepID=UPI000555532A|nr:ATP-binding protein [Nitratidesulfovibrio termitidis]
MRKDDADGAAQPRPRSPEHVSEHVSNRASEHAPEHAAGARAGVCASAPGGASVSGDAAQDRLRLLEEENRRLREALGLRPDDHVPCGVPLHSSPTAPPDGGPRLPRPASGCWAGRPLYGVADPFVEMVAPAADGLVCAYVSDIDTHEVLHVNAALRRLVGDCEGRRCHEALQGRDTPCPFCNNGRLRDEPEKAHVWEFRNPALNRWFRCIDRLVPLGDGRLARYELAVDITDMKETEEAMRRFRAALDATAEAIFLIDPVSGLHVDVNRGACALLGLSRQQLLTMGPCDINPTLTRDRCLEISRTVLGGTPLLDQETRYCRSDGSLVPVELSTSAWHSARGDLIVAVARDISERVRIRNEMQLRLLYDRVLSTCARDLLARPCADDTLRVVLESLREAAGACRVYIFENHQDAQGKPCCSQRYERCAPGVPPQIDNPLLRDVPYATVIPRWRHELEAGRVIRGPVATFPESERVVLESQGIRSLLVLPIVAQGRWYGFIGFDDTRRPRVWESVDLKFLQTAGEIIGAALERRRTEQTLAESARGLEEASRAKSEFLANMSHEIRTPLNAIIGLTELSLQEHLPADVAENLRAALVSAEALLGIVNDLLDLSRVEAGKLRLECIDFAPARLVRGVMRVMGHTAERKGLALTLHIDRDVPRHLRGDPGRLRQVLVNFISNAIKFTDEGGVHVVVCRAEPPHVPGTPHTPHTPDVPDLSDVSGMGGGAARGVPAPGASSVTPADGDTQWLCFSVRDTGIGIPDDKHELIFENFRQADATTARRYGGSGLGLAICRKFTDMMGGHIVLDSAPGQGSTFRVLLPFGVCNAGSPAPSRDAAAPSTPCGQPGMPSAPCSVAEGRADHGWREAGGARLTSPPRLVAADPLRILLVESDDVNRHAVSRALARGGHDPVSVVTGHEALEMARTQRFDLAVVDAHPRDMDGADVVRALRRLTDAPTPSDVPVLLMTGDPAGVDQAALEAAGGVSVALKPVRLKTLLAAVEGMVGGAGEDTLRRSSPAPVDEPPVFNAATLLVGGDEASLRFLRQSGTLRESLWSAMDRGSRVELIALSHLLRLEAEAIGAERVRQMAERMELRTRSAGAEETRPVFMLLMDALNQLEHELRKMQRGAVPVHEGPRAGPGSGPDAGPDAGPAGASGSGQEEGPGSGETT